MLTVQIVGSKTLDLFATVSTCRIVNYNPTSTSAITNLFHPVTRFPCCV